MKHTKKHHYHHQSSLSLSQKYPHVFAWKTATLVVLVLISIVGIIAICLGIYLINHPNPTANMSFVNEIVRDSTVVQTGQQIRNLLANMIKADPKLYFQDSLLLFKGTGNNFTAEVLKQNIFGVKSKNLLFIFDVKKMGSIDPNLFGFFVHADFPMPKNQDYNMSIDYYTFQYGSTRQSVVFSMENNEYLVMNGSKDQYTLKSFQASDNILCKTYYFSQSSNYFGILSLFQATLNQQPILSLMNLNESLGCYGNVQSEQELEQKLTNIIGFDIRTQTITIDQFEVYYLNNQN